MSSDDSDSGGGEHSDGESPGGGPESQPRDPETGQFLPKDERGETEDSESAETGPDRPADSDEQRTERSDTRSHNGDREDASKRRGQRPQESPERQISAMELYALPPTHPLARALTGPAASGSGSGRERPPTLDLVTLQVRWDGRPVLGHAADAEGQPGPAQPVRNPRTRPSTETVQQAPPTGAEPQRAPKTGPQRAPPAEPRQFPEATPRHPSTGGTGPATTASARSNPTRPTDAGSEPGPDSGQWAGPGRGRSPGRDEPRW